MHQNFLIGKSIAAQTKATIATTMQKPIPSPITNGMSDQASDPEQGQADRYLFHRV